MTLVNLQAAHALRAVDANGDPVSGAKLYFYLPNTTTALTTYQDSGGVTQHPSPIIADSNGYFGDIFGTFNQYKVLITTSADVDLPGYPLDYINTTIARADLGPQFLRTTDVTVTDTTFALQSDTAKVRLFIQAAGGPGGGVLGVSTNEVAAGGPGYAGDLIDTGFIDASGVSTISITIGAAGSASVGAAGATSSSTTVVVDGATYIAAGGRGGELGNNVQVVRSITPTSTNATSTAPTGRIFKGDRGGTAFIHGGSALFAQGAEGGSSRYGQGGVSQRLAAGESPLTGADASGYGAGGGGGVIVTGAARAGGAGSAAVVIVEEYTS